MRRVVLAIGLTSVLCGCATYAPSPRAAQAAPAARGVTPAASVALSAEQAAMIRTYYRDADPKPGQGRGHGGLPPGIAKNLARGKPLPPGIAKQYLPSDLARRLPAPPAGFDYVVAAGKLLLVEAATQVVREILLDAVFG